MYYAHCEEYNWSGDLHEDKTQADQDAIDYMRMHPGRTAIVLEQIGG